MRKFKALEIKSSVEGRTLIAAIYHNILSYLTLLRTYKNKKKQTLEI